jgi:hypothetical protein
MTPEQLMNGGNINGQVVGPVTLLFNALQTRFAPLNDETRLAALTNMMGFARRPNERINELLTRFETTHIRATNEASFSMNFEGMSYMLLRAIGVTDQQLIQLLAPTGGTFPSDQPQHTNLHAALRRMGHVLEHQPGNIAQSLLRVQQPTQHEPRDAERARQQGRNTRTFFNDPDQARSGTVDKYAGGGYDTHSWNEPQLADWDQSHLANSALTAARLSDQLGDGVLGDLSEIDTDTESDLFEELDYADLAGLTPAEQGEAIYWAYSQGKQKWRRFSAKPTRKVRRFAKRKGGKGKRGRHASSFMAPSEVEAFFKGKGKQMRKFSRKHSLKDSRS